jgi:hypothetical protein
VATRCLRRHHVVPSNPALQLDELGLSRLTKSPKRALSNLRQSAAGAPAATSSWRPSDVNWIGDGELADIPADGLAIAARVRSTARRRRPACCRAARSNSTSRRAASRPARRACSTNRATRGRGCWAGGLSPGRRGRRARGVSLESPAAYAPSFEVLANARAPQDEVRVNPTAGASVASYQLQAARCNT